MKKLTEQKIKQALEFAYDKAINEVLKLDFSNIECHHTECNKIVKTHKIKAGFYGFITGVGGLFWIPLTLPTNITLIFYLQIKMIATIAHLAGYDLKDEEVKTMIFACLTGDNAHEILKEIGIDIEKHITRHISKHISQKTITQIQRKIGFKLLAKLGEKGFLSFTRLIPLISGILGGSNDFLNTHKIGDIAKKVFIDKETKLLK